MIVGIDLGTTYSAIAYINALGRPEILPNREGEQITPSVVLFQGDMPLVGTMAKRSAAGSPEDYVALVKRQMGNPSWVFESAAGEKYTPEKVSAIIIKRLIEDAELILGEGSITDAIITVPAYFDDAQRRATKDAGTIAGINVPQVLNEPTAAAIAYGVESEQEGTYLVFDLGGGTFDVTIINIASGVFKELATGGDKNLGGFDWDNTLMTLVADRFVAEGGDDPRDDNAAEADLRERAEIAKRSLTSVPKANVMISHGGMTKSISVTREEFEQVSASLVNKCRDLMESVMEEAGLGWGDLTGLLLVGGSTRMPMIHSMVKEASGLEPIKGIQVDEVVALGAAVNASLVTSDPGMGVSSGDAGAAPVTVAGREIEVFRVTSQGLGVIVQDPVTREDVNSIIIPPNTPIPAQMSEEYATVSDQQTAVEVRVTQGDDHDPAYVSVVGSQTLKLSPRPANSPIQVTFSYDVDQMIFIEVVDLVDGSSLGTFEVRNDANMDRGEVEKARLSLANQEIG